mmetsp:Transcript_20887/g.43882  ORF Transcript_20887/g.43882 Transcript_20887/m.43882 type:complete len:80 (-) Transcript_20887:114-353(-)
MMSYHPPNHYTTKLMSYNPPNHYTTKFPDSSYQGSSSFPPFRLSCCCLSYCCLMVDAADVAVDGGDYIGGATAFYSFLF